LENTGDTQDEIAAIQSLYLNLDNNKENRNRQNQMEEAVADDQTRLYEMKEYYQESKSREDQEWQQREG
jgi:hypothetical protein